MKCTIVSIIPFSITREFPGVYPGSYTIPECKAGDIQVFYVNDAKSYLYVLDGKGISTNTEASGIAKSIVEDTIRAQINYNDDGHPGLFWLEGEVSKTDVLSKHKNKLEEAKTKQFNWFKRLVAAADDDWQRYHQYKSISDVQRIAARQLGLVRDWIDVIPENESNCPACGSVVKVGYPICANCKAVINPELAKKIQFSTALA